MKLSESYERIRTAVVGIARPFKKDLGYIYILIGTGICIDPKGYIITAYHVVKSIIEENDSKLAVIFSKSNEKMFEAHIVMITQVDGNKEEDVAVIKVISDDYYDMDGDLKETNYPFVKAKMRENIKVGDEIATIGFPLRNEEFSHILPDLYKGIISRIDYHLGENCYMDNIMLDINLNVGNSGGSVFDVSSAELIGIVLSCKKASDFVIEYDKKDEIIENREYLRDTNMVNCLPWSRIEYYYNRLKEKTMT